MKDGQGSGGPVTNLIVFGRGLEPGDTKDSLRLTEPGRLRVAAAHRHVTDYAAAFTRRDQEGDRGRIVFSGGWPGAAAGMAPPPPDQREGVLMREYFSELGAVAPVDVLVETRSDSTLENALCIREDGCFADRTFGPDDPLGLVGHEGHLVRIDYFIRKVLKLPATAVVHIPAAEPDTFAAVPEHHALRLARVICFGARRPATLRRRHRWLVTAGRLAVRPTRPQGIRSASGSTSASTSRC